MVTIGVDAHKAVHAAVAIDDAGRELGRWRGANRPAAWEQLRVWAATWADDRRWGVEGAWGYGRGLAQHLVAAGESVFEVNARLTAGGRLRARKTDKTDDLDAAAVARIVRQEERALPEIQTDDESALLSLLTTEREELIREGTRIQNQLHHLLLQFDPAYKDGVGRLTTKRALLALGALQAPTGNALQEHRAAAIRRLVARLALTTEHTKDVAKQIRALASARYAALTQLCGVDHLTAGMLAGLLGPGVRFETDAQLAAYAGVAPREASSGARVRHRLSRGGNRRLNSIIYRIAVTQARHSTEAKRYIARRMSQGKTKREAHRALRRYIVRVLWHLWHECYPADATAVLKVAA